jgi:serine/threonine protein kinase
MALEIVQILAAGTFGHVAVVRDTATDLLMAAKVLKAEHLENLKLVRRLRDEAVLLSRLAHPNIVEVFGIREVADRPILLLEWVRGAPLDALMVRMPDGLPAAEALELIRICTGALRAAYESVDPVSGLPMRVIHRDFKPSNVLLDQGGRVKVLDFGIAKGDFVGKESETITVVLGAHGYLAPERLDGAEDSPKGDVYALGCSLYELLTARRMKLSLHPLAHNERLQKELMRMQPPGISPRTVSDLAELITTCCAYDPERRPNHGELLEGLTRIQLSAGLGPDLERLARKQVIPVLEGLSFESVHKHPAYKDLRFLEARTGDTPAGAPPRRIDGEIRAFLSPADWHKRAGELRRMLAADPSWTAEPFLEHLDRVAGGRFWRRWRADADSRDQIAVVLELLRARPGPGVAERVRPLMKHWDAEVCALARQVASPVS